MDSLRLLFETVQAERQRQLAHFDALDGKAGVLLGFAGVELALTPAIAWPARLAALTLLVAAAGLAALAFLPRQLPVLDVAALRGYLRMVVAEGGHLVAVHDTLVQMVGEGSAGLAAKGKLLQRSVILLAMGSLILAAGLAGGGHRG